MSEFNYKKNLHFNNNFDINYFHKLIKDTINIPPSIIVNGDDIKIIFENGISDEQSETIEILLNVGNTVNNYNVILPMTTYRNPKFYFNTSNSYSINSINFTNIKTCILPILPLGVYKLLVSCKYSYQNKNNNLTLRVKFTNIHSNLILDIFKSTTSTFIAKNCYILNKYIPITQESESHIYLDCACQKNNETAIINDISIELIPI